MTPVSVSAVILAGGKGTRLRPVVSDRPKPLALVAGRSFLEHILNRLRHDGFGEAVLCVGYMADMVEAMLGPRNQGVRLHYSRENIPLDTAGAFRHALPHFSGSHILGLNGDTFIDTSYAHFVAQAIRVDADAVLGIVWSDDAGSYGRVLRDDAGTVVTFAEKGEAGSGWVNAGVYLFRRQMLVDLPTGPLSLERHVLPQLAASGRLASVALECAFIDIGTPESYARAQALPQFILGKHRSVSEE